MIHYPITQEFLEGIPQIQYRKGEGTYEGVVCHCTDSVNRSGGDTPHRERSYEQNTWESAFVHFFIGMENDQVVILQTAPTDYISWGCGKGNDRFVNIELCMYDDYQTFLKVYDAYVYLIAKLLYDKKLGVSPANPNGSGTCWSHADVAHYIGGTTHEDPIQYLLQHGITWDDHIQYVTERYNQFVAEQKEQVKEEPKPSPTFDLNQYKYLSTLAMNNDGAAEWAKGELSSMMSHVTTGVKVAKGDKSIEAVLIGNKTFAPVAEVLSLLGVGYDYTSENKTIKVK